MNINPSIRSQIEIISRPRSYVRLVKPCAVGDGIVCLSCEQKNFYLGTYERKRADFNTSAFIPASGAASRMFAGLVEKDAEFLEKFANKIKKFAFYNDLKNASLSLDKGDIDSLSHTEIADLVLSPEGLGYAHIPKGLVKFHKYGDISTTAFEEYVALTPSYADGVHFTVPEDFPDDARRGLSETGDGFEVSFSTQSAKTHTVSICADGGVLTDEDNKIVFRPAGHGALLENLSRIRADIVFISNIDNIAHRERVPGSAFERKALAGLLIENMENEPRQRPLRVCGVVKNAGEPGGGPFWVENASGVVSLRIVESAEVDHGNPEQEQIWRSATHFNPVDMVCSLKDAGSGRVDFEIYSDNSFIVTDKVFNDRTVKVLEMPGLWNGAMAGWDTIFVEIKPENFNPVKNVFDLLNASHQDLDGE